MSFEKNFIKDFANTIFKIDQKKLLKIVKLLFELRKKKNRLFIIGLGGSAGNASHAVNDFRKLCQINAISPTDNVSELSATANDTGFENIFVESLKISQISKNDILMVMSVGGGSYKKKSSIAIINAIKYAAKKKCKIISFTGKKNGYAAKNSFINISCEIKNFYQLTPFAESAQVVIWHLLVSHPKLQLKKTFW